MQIHGMPSPFGLEQHGLERAANVFWNLKPAQLVEEIIQRKEGKLSDKGEVFIFTGKYTGRNPDAKYIVENSATENKHVCWESNKRMSPATFAHLRDRFSEHLVGKDLFIQDLAVGADSDFKYSLRVISETAWGALFASNLFIRSPLLKANLSAPEITVIHCPDFQAAPAADGTNSEVVIALDFSNNLILIGGTGYAGELKKSVFTIMNFLMPARNVLPMHCAANQDSDGNTALFFGLSGTGKTTLSNDKGYRLIGDDEHGWTDSGIFNFEGGCYAKTVHLSKKMEPHIWEGVRRFGTLLENVTYDQTTHVPNFNDTSVTENTRAAFSYEGLNFVKRSGKGIPPKNIFFLSADAFGLLPPISKLTEEQAGIYFLLGYTAKVAGTEEGLSLEPRKTFSTCFAAPFLPLLPRVYARMLKEKISHYRSNVWLINTGWTGGPFGIGQRIPLAYTRNLIRAVLNGSLIKGNFEVDPYFGLNIPSFCDNVPQEILNPISTWKDKKGYTRQAALLNQSFLDTYAQMT